MPVAGLSYGHGIITYDVCGNEGGGLTPLMHPPASPLALGINLVSCSAGYWMSGIKTRGRLASMERKAAS